MADAPVVHIGENSPEKVAHKLTHEVLSYERPEKITRKLLLDTYAECLRRMHGRRVIK